jgi:anti-sigma28 factor (negative regulator of flagellin synthesis)
MPKPSPKASWTDHGTNTRKNEEIMRSHGDTAHHSPVGPSVPQMKTIPAQDMPSARGRPTQVDRTTSSPRLWEIQQAGKVLTQTLEVRETRIVALRSDIESGHYSVEAEQVAEKIMKDLLLDLFRY